MDNLVKQLQRLNEITKMNYYIYLFNSGGGYVRSEKDWTTFNFEDQEDLLTQIQIQIDKFKQSTQLPPYRKEHKLG